MDSQTWAAIFGAGGFGAILLALVKGIMNWLNGSHGREKARNMDALAQRDDAWRERDHHRDRASAADARADRERARGDAEHRRRRQVSEYASTLRSELLARGVLPDELPPWPEHFTPTDQEDQ